MEIDTVGGDTVWQIELARRDGSEVELDLDARSGERVSTSSGGG